MDTTYKVVFLGGGSIGPDAKSLELAKIACPSIDREDREGRRLAIEQTDWQDHSGEKRIQRTIVIEVEPAAGEWQIGPG